MTRTKARYGRSSTYGKEPQPFSVDPEEPNLGYEKADENVLNTQEYIDALLAQRDELLKEVERLQKKTDSLQDSETVKRNYRLEQHATRIYAALIASMLASTHESDSITSGEFESAARMAVQAAEALCREFDEKKETEMT